jgi:dTMP kinase
MSGKHVTAWINTDKAVSVGHGKDLFQVGVPCLMTLNFVTFEGVDGSGKSTVVKKVVYQLKREGYKVTLTMEPSLTWLGDAVRRSYTEDVSPYTEVFLFMADRATHTDWVRKKIAQGRLVLSDRYSDSTVAYQGALLFRRKGGPLERHIEWLAELNDKIILEPDMTFLLDIDPIRSLRRLDNRNARSKFERLKYLRMVREGYLKIAEMKKRMLIIDASQPIEDVTAFILNEMKKRLWGKDLSNRGSISPA